MRYARESGAETFTYVPAGTTDSKKYSVLADGAPTSTVLATTVYYETAAAWYKLCKTTYGFETWSALGSSSFNGALFQSFASAIYETPNLVTFKGVAALAMNLAICETLAVLYFYFC